VVFLTKKGEKSNFRFWRRGDAKGKSKLGIFYSFLGLGQKHLPKNIQNWIFVSIFRVRAKPLLKNIQFWIFVSIFRVRAKSFTKKYPKLDFSIHI
jgi:hypothetical protein